MNDLVRSIEKSSPEKEERQEEFELEKESTKFKKKRATRAQIEVETSLIKGEHPELRIVGNYFVYLKLNQGKCEGTWNLL